MECPYIEFYMSLLIRSEYLTASSTLGWVGAVGLKKTHTENLLRTRRRDGFIGRARSCPSEASIVRVLYQEISDEYVGSRSLLCLERATRPMSTLYNKLLAYFQSFQMNSKHKTRTAGNLFFLN